MKVDVTLPIENGSVIGHPLYCPYRHEWDVVLSFASADAKGPHQTG